LKNQSELNIGLIGHVDHGKTTVTKALSGVWTDKHSEEIKRGISIRLGYADCEFYKCSKCSEPDCYCTSPKCTKCGGKTEFQRKLSLVDAPGHETLMATMLSGAALMDGAVVVIAANEDCPQPQTIEHLMALDIVGVDKIVIAQNKIDLVSEEKAKENYQQIKDFLATTKAKDAPIIPIAAHYGVNIEVLINAIEEHIPTPERDLKADPRMYVARSFDINKPGTGVDTLVGGIVGGSLISGKLSVGDEIEFRPGVKRKKDYEPVSAKVTGLNAGNVKLDSASPGGLIGVATQLDPSLSKSDGLLGNMLGKPGTLPPVHYTLKLDVKMLDRTVGDSGGSIKPLVKGEPLMLNIGSAMTVGTVVDMKTNTLALKIPVCAQYGDKVAVSRRFGARWHLIGYGIIQE